MVASPATAHGPQRLFLPPIDVPAASDSKSRAAIRGGDVLLLPFERDGTTSEVPIRIRPYSVRDRAHFAVHAVGAGGVDLGAVAPPAKTVRGEALDSSRIRFAGSLLDDGLHGIAFLPDGSRHELTPIRGAGPHVYTLTPVGAPTVHGLCGMPDTPGEGGVAGDAAPPVNQTCIVQMACDADFEYFTAWGSDVDAVVARIELVTNVMNLQYEGDVGLTHQLTSVLVRTTPGAPYTSSAHATLLNQFRNEWNANQTSIVRDVAQLFTGKELIGVVVGVAFGFGEICDVPNSYCLAQSDFDGTLACSTDLSAHELGHLWNATHCICVAPPTTMNASILCANTFQSSPTPAQIIPFANAIGCLECTLVDCNANGIGDLDDITAGTSEDCDGNNIPDECDLANGAGDCNANGLLDVCDAFTAPSYDCNENGVFDECDLANGTSVDLDGTGLPDECDPDCNNNGVADGIDLQNGTSPDCDANGEPDECQWADGIGIPIDISSDGVLVWNDQTPWLAGTFVDGQPMLVAVWIRSLGPWGPDGELFVARSTDQGFTWTDPAAVVSNGSTNSGIDLTARAATLRTGRIAIVWASAAKLDQPGTNAFREIQIVRTDDGGATWSTPAYVHPTPFADSAQDAAPDVAGSESDVAIAVWQSKSMPGAGNDGDIAVARSLDSGVTWAAPALLNSSGIGDSFEDVEPRIAYGGGTRWLAVWVSRTQLPGGIGDDRDIHAALSEDDGVTWSAPFAINPDALADGTRVDVDPTVEGDGEGGFLVAWSSQGAGGSEGTDSDVWLRRSANGSEWQSATNLSGPDTLDQGQPALARIGSAIRLAWRTVGVIFAPFGSDQDVFTIASDDDGDTWTAIQPLLPDAASDGTRNDARPSMGTVGDSIAVAFESIPMSEGDIVGVQLRFPDCNGNGVEDACEIAAGAAEDVNENSIPDECEQSLLGDLDRDGVIGPIDIAILLGAWGSTGGVADLDGDGSVGAPDLAILLGAWSGA
jgi:Metallo-peptidase family M12